MVADFSLKVNEIGYLTPALQVRDLYIVIGYLVLTERFSEIVNLLPHLVQVGIDSCCRVLDGL